ncbi:MAG: hypothetical protein R3B72_10575 [Polyangiaceae bacterium]
MARGPRQGYAKSVVEDRAQALRSDEEGEGSFDRPERASDAPLTAPRRGQEVATESPRGASPRGAWRRPLAGLLLGGLLAGGAWGGTGRYLEAEARQEAADAWDAARLCLLGDGLHAGTVPSRRLRQITLTVRYHADPAHPWPARCAPHADRLDAALTARALVRELGPLPSLGPLTRDADPLAHGEVLDRLAAELAVANLPLFQRDLTVPPAPAPSPPRLRRDQLVPLGRVEALDRVDVALDPQRGEVLRLLLPDRASRICHFDPASDWRKARCRPTPVTIPEGARASLTRAAPGGGDLVVLRDAGDEDGFYDARTGQRILRPRYFDAQGMVAADGSSRLLYADLRNDEPGERVERFRLLDLQPGRRPNKRRLRIPRDARVLHLASSVLWWRTERPTEDERFAARDALFNATFTDGERVLATPTRVGELPEDTRAVADCASGDTVVVLLTSGLRDKRYSLVFVQGGVASPPQDVGSIEGRLSLSCDDGAALLTRKLQTSTATGASRWRCRPSKGDRSSCEPAEARGLPSPKKGLAEVAPLDDDLALAWAAEAEPLRLRIAEADDLHEARDIIVLEDELHGGLEPIALRWVTANGRALLLLQDVGRRVYALRVERSGKLEPVSLEEE